MVVQMVYVALVRSRCIKD